MLAWTLAIREVISSRTPMSETCDLDMCPVCFLEFVVKRTLQNDSHVRVLYV